MRSRLLVIPIALLMIPLWSGTGGAADVDDAGWTPAPSSPSGAAVWGAGGGATTMVASTINSGAFYSNDNGRNWLPAGTDVDEGEVAFDPSDPDRGYLAGFGGMDRTTDGGATWTKVLTITPVFRVAVADDGTVAAVSRVGGEVDLHVSRDGGDTFVTYDSGVPDWNSVYGVVFGDTSDDILIMTFGQSYLTHDGGVTWSQPTAGGRDVTRTADGALWIAGWGELRRSTDNGDTWQTLPAPPANPKLIAPRPAGGVWGATSQGLLLTVDNGASWIDVGFPEVSFAATAMYADPHDPEALFVGDENLGVNRIFPTADGYGFEGRSAGFPPIEVTALGGSPDGSVLLAGGGLGMYASRDGGATWSHTGAGIGHPSMSAVGANADGTVLFAGGRGWILQPYMLVSRDGGASWTHVTTSANDGTVAAFAAHPTDPDRAWAALWIDLAASHVLETTDGGATWTSVFESPLHVRDVAYHGPSSTLLVGTEAGVLARPDGSVAFVPMTAAPLGAYFVEVTGGAIAAEGEAMSVWRNTLDAPALAPWADTGSFLTTLAVSTDGTVYAGADGATLARCVDDGAFGTCADVTPAPGTNVAYVDPATGTVWAGTDDDGLFIADA